MRVAKQRKIDDGVESLDDISFLQGLKLIAHELSGNVELMGQLSQILSRIIFQFAENLKIDPGKFQIVFWIDIEVNLKISLSNC